MGPVSQAERRPQASLSTPKGPIAPAAGPETAFNKACASCALLPRRSKSTTSRERSGSADAAAREEA